MKDLERKNGGRERVEVEAEEVREKKGLHGQKPKPRAVAVHHGR